MSMSTAQPGGILPSDGRKPIVRTFVNLYRSDIAFRGMVDFAVIGAAVLLFLHPPAQVRSWLGLSGGSGSQQQAGVVPQPAPAPQPGRAAPGGTQSKPQIQTQAPPAKPIVFPQEISKPSLANVMLVEISENAFRTSSAADQQRLLAARTAHRSGRQAEILDLLKDADGHDANVAFMRGMGYLVRGDEESVKAGEAALRTAVGQNHSLAKLLLGRVLITAPKGITKNVEEGQKLIEAVASTGDAQAERVAAIAYISADFGSFQPDRAATLFKKAAEAGDPQAMFHYARLLDEGIGAPADHAAAVDFLGRAAAAGLTSAQFALGSWLADLYIAKATDDPREAVSWLEKALEKGFSLLALNKLQNIYGWTGRAPPWNDKSKFFALAQKCSGIAEVYCQNSVALAYQFGWGGGADPVRAYVHKLIARDLGHPGVKAKDVDDLGNKLTSKERADATERARVLRQKLRPPPALVVFQYPDVVRSAPWASIEEVEKFDTPATTQPSQQQGSSTPAPGAIDFYKYIASPTGFYYWTIAFDSAAYSDRSPRLQAALRAALAAYRDKEPQRMLDALAAADAEDPAVNLLKGIAALTLAESKNGPENRTDAVRYFRAAADAGDAKAAAILGNLLTLKVAGITQDIARARDYAERAARSSDGFAVRQLAIDVLAGSFGEANPTRAADLMWTAAELGDPAANAMVAAMFQNGTGVPRDMDKAETYLRRSAGLGYTDARLILGDWIIDRYAKKTIPSPDEGVRILENAYRDANSVYAARRLSVLYDYEGREPPWRDRKKALDQARKCAPYSYQACHISLGVIYHNLNDVTRAWAHYNIARGLGWDEAAQRLDRVEKSMTKSEIEQARSLSDQLKRDLKPVPTTIAIVDKSAAGPALSPAGLVPVATSQNFADELTDWAVPPQASLKYEVGSRTPFSLPGATRITTQDVRQMAPQALLVDVLDEAAAHLTIPGAAHVPGGGNFGDGRFNDHVQDKFEAVMTGLVRRNPDKPIIFFCASAQCWESYNAGLRALKMGLRSVLWYRGGIASWKAAGLPLARPAERYQVK